MLSLVLGSEIIDSLVAAIVSTYSKLELLDLSWVESNLHHLNCRCLNSWTVVIYFLSLKLIEKMRRYMAYQLLRGVVYGDSNSD